MYPCVILKEKTNLGKRFNVFLYRLSVLKSIFIINEKKSRITIESICT